MVWVLVFVGGALLVWVLGAVWLALVFAVVERLSSREWCVDEDENTGPCVQSSRL